MWLALVAACFSIVELYFNSLILFNFNLKAGFQKRTIQTKLNETLTECMEITLVKGEEVMIG